MYPVYPCLNRLHSVFIGAALPTVTLDESPLANRENVTLHYREAGSGTVPLLFLHGGWGYEIYPFDRQLAALGEHFRILIPDRSGYGKSARLEIMQEDFHQRAAAEMRLFLDALHIERAALWGHSDGSVIAVHMALEDPARYYGIILEAFHFYRDKPGSRDFFETMMNSPQMLGERVAQVLAAAHGADYWESLIRMNGNAWLQIARSATETRQDLYDGRLREVQTPTLFLHGSRDPRTEPDELASVRQQLPDAPIHLIESGGHSPHSESAAAAESTRRAREFLATVAPL